MATKRKNHQPTYLQAAAATELGRRRLRRARRAAAHYLGPYDSPASREAYHRLLAQWEAGGGQVPLATNDVTVAELCLRFMRHAETYCRKPGGTPTSSLPVHKMAIGPLAQLYGRSMVSDFGPVALKAVRQAHPPPVAALPAGGRYGCALKGSPF